MKKRIYVITDSIGCPREETMVEVTWVDRFIQKWGGDYAIYTYCQRGLSLGNVVSDYVLQYSPDVIITQMGIVDSARRVLRPMVQNFLSKLLGNNSKIIKNYIQKNHYKLTQKKDYHYFSIEGYKAFYNNLLRLSQTNLIIVPIQPASDYMKKQVYRIQEDIDLYNEVFYEIAQDYPNRVFVAETWDRISEMEAYVLSDGHHLTENGHNLVFDSVDKIMTEISNGLQS